MNTSTTAAGGVATNAPSVPIMRGVEYRCGDCGARNLIKGGDPVRCRQCGFRILYKTRTKRCKYFAITSASEDGIVFATMSTDLCSANYFLMGGGASVGDAIVDWGGREIWSHCETGSGNHGMPQVLWYFNEDTPSLW